MTGMTARTRLYGVTLAMAGVAMIGLSGTAQAKAIETPATAREAPEQQEKQDKKSSAVTVKDGRLSVQVQDRTLGWVLQTISEKARIAIAMNGGVGGEQVSVQFQNLPLEEGLRRLLNEHDAFLFYTVRDRGPAALTAVWVYPKGRGQGLAPVPPEVWASSQELRGKLADPDPNRRAAAVAALLERGGDQGLDVAAQGLRDGDATVRSMALYSASAAHVALPPDTLRELALTDPSADVRFLALEALARDPTIGAIATQALNDPSPAVQAKAKEILERQRAAAEGPRPASPTRKSRQR